MPIPGFVAAALKFGPPALALGKELFSGKGDLGEIAKTGFAPGELDSMIRLINQQFGARQRSGQALTRQSTAGAPRSTQRAAAAQEQDQGLAALLQAITQIQTLGAQRRFGAASQLASIAQRNREGLIQNLSNLGFSQGFGSLQKLPDQFNDLQDAVSSLFNQGQIPGGTEVLDRFSSPNLRNTA